MPPRISKVVDFSHSLDLFSRSRNDASYLNIISLFAKLALKKSLFHDFETVFNVNDFLHWLALWVARGLHSD